MTNYTYIFRVDRFVVKIYTCQGVFATERLTASHAFQLAEAAKRKIETAVSSIRGVDCVTEGRSA
jgi:hypothetical protein